MTDYHIQTIHVTLQQAKCVKRPKVTLLAVIIKHSREYKFAS